MSGYSKPIPVPDLVSEPFWSGLRDGVLLLQCCRVCKRFQFYPRSLCVHCGNMELHWVPVEGTGSVYSYTVIFRSRVPGWHDEVPYVVAVIELDEGPRLQSNILFCDPGDVAVGARVRPSLQKVTESLTLPMFVLDR